MRKFVLAVILFLFVFSAAKAQYINRDQYTLWQGRMGIGVNIASPYSSIIPSNVHLMLGDSGTTKALLLPRVIHTSDISIPVRGMFIYCYDSASPLYYSGSAWVKLGISSGGTNIYNSDGTLTSNRMIDGNDKELSIGDLRSLVLTAESPFGSPTMALSTTNGRDTTSEIKIYLSDIEINPYRGGLKIDTLTDSPGTKTLRYDPTTGLVSYGDTAAGGSYADSLRRSGLTVQMRKGGVWTNQFDLPDSGGATPTLQQVLTAGNVLTNAGNYINIGGNSLSITGSTNPRNITIDNLNASPKIKFNGLFGNAYLQRSDGVFVINTDAEMRLDASSRIMLNSAIYTQIPNKLKIGYSVGPPDSALLIESGFKYKNGSQGTGKVLTSDANGGASWADLPVSVSYADSLRRSGLTVQMRKGGVWTNQYTDSVTFYDSTLMASVQRLKDTAAAIRADFPTGTSCWGLVGNSIDAAANFIGTTNNASFRIRTNNTLTAVFDSITGQLRLVNGTDPMIALEQTITGQKWLLRNGVGTGLSNSSFNIYDATAGKIRFIINQDGDVAIGNVSSIPTVSQLYIYGGGSGANIDARGDSTNEQRDEANIEVEHPDYDGSSFNANGVAMQVNGNVTTGTFMGYPKKNSGQLRFTNKTNIIVVKNNASLRFGTNNTERMVLDSLGRLGIGVLSAGAALHVYNQDSGEPTAIFDAHEDRPGTIIEARHAGVITSAFDTYGAVLVVDNSAQPTTPESGYSKIYSRNDSLRFMNDAGVESTLGAVKYDTCTLATFSAGAGLSTDTAAFQTTSIYGSFYNDGNDTLIITKQMSILQGSSPSITPTVYWNDSLNVTAGAVKLVNSPSALTNTATGTAVTSFDNYKVPPGVWVWVATPTVGTKPTYFSLSLIGYKKRI